MSEQQQGQHVAASDEQQPVQQPTPTQPEQTVPVVEQPVPTETVNREFAGAPGSGAPEQQPGAAETTDKGDGEGDQPTADEQADAGDGDVTEPAPSNPHTEDGEPGSAGLGVTGKFVQDDEAPGDEDAGSQ